MPQRYQRSRKAGWKKPQGVENISRPSMFGNPFIIRMGLRKDDWVVYFQRHKYADFEFVKSHESKIAAQTHAVELFDQWFDDAIASKGTPLHDFREKYGWRGFQLACAAATLLRGKDVMCWCKLTDPCHGDVILRKVNR